ncbi:MAG: hypothetical protein Q4D82_01355 [Neisseria sp.]|nr:hypothetical protein [Neisseria sp.]
MVLNNPSYLGQPLLEISNHTFDAICNRQPEVSASYKKGRAKAVASVAQSLLKQAKNGNVTAQIFYLKTQAGWRETQTVDNISSDGSMTPPKQTPFSKAELQEALQSVMGKI